MKALFSFFIVILLLSAIPAQEIGIAPTKIWTDNREIQNPFGYSVYYFQKIWKIGLKAEYVAAKNERKYYGLVISGFLQNPDEVRYENVSSSSDFRAIEFSVIVPDLIQFEGFNFNFGGGLSFDKFKGERYGLESGKEATLFEKNKTGVFYSASISRSRLFELPVKIEFLFKGKSLSGRNFTTDIEDPFAGAIGVYELQFNLSLLL